MSSAVPVCPLCCKPLRLERCPVTAEVASSSLVVPAIPFKELAPISVKHFGAQKDTVSYPFWLSRKPRLIRNSIHLEGEILQFPVTFHLENDRITGPECADNHLQLRHRLQRGAIDCTNNVPGLQSC